MRISNLTRLFLIGCLIAFIALPTHAIGDTQRVKYPANLCRAAVEAQDFAFRVFNDRYKNQSNFSVFAVCPVSLPHAIGQSITVHVSVLNETTASRSITCNGYMHDYGLVSNGSYPNYVGGTTPWLATSNTISAQPNTVGVISLSLGGNNGPAIFSEQMNIVCLMPANSSILYYTNESADFFTN